MQTRVFEIYDSANKDISAVCEILKNGGVVALPTETVYGLAANAQNEDAVQKIFAAKGRPADNPLIVHIANKAELAPLVKEIPQAAQRCIDAFWPGPFTVILPKTDAIPPITSGGLDTVAVRMPSNPVINAVISGCGFPLAAPSANISGKPSPTKASHVIEDMQGKIEGIVKSYDCTVGVESTVVSFINGEARLLRPGGITLEMLQKEVPDIIVDDGVLHTVKKALSPGMKYKHYAPNCNVTLIQGSSSAFCDFANKSGLFAVCLKEDEQNLKNNFISLGEKPEAALFSSLRKLDELGIKRAVCHAPGKSGTGLAVYNRMLRACGFNIVKLPYIIGVTGPSGSGKTSLGMAAKKLGITAIDCDKFAKDIVESLKTELCDAFGDDIYKNGKLDRALLADRAFSSAEDTEKLNKITLPRILSALKQKIKEIDKGFVILDGATLIESGGADMCNRLIAVLSKKEDRLSRFSKRDNLNIRAAQKRLTAAKDDSFYKAAATDVIENTATIEEFSQNCQELLQNIISFKER